jgi:hypothetical protein
VDDSIAAMDATGEAATTIASDAYVPGEKEVLSQMNFISFELAFYHHDDNNNTHIHKTILHRLA